MKDPDHAAVCADCGCTLTRDERHYYEFRCEFCERQATHLVDRELEEGDLPDLTLDQLHAERTTLRAQLAAALARAEVLEREKAELRSEYAKLVAAHDETCAECRALEAALRECADDLEAELNARHFMPNGKPHPALQHDYDNDIATVLQARALLAQPAAGIPEGSRDGE